MSVEGFVGFWGHGKTIMMVRQILRDLRKRPDTLIGNNFGFRGSNAVDLQTLEDVLAFACTDFGRPKILAIDEIGMLLRSGSSNSVPWPPEADLLFMQGRKLGVEVYWTTQSWRFLNVNVRRVTHRVSECTGYWFKRVSPKGAWPEVKRPRLFRVRVFKNPNPESAELPRLPSGTKWALWDDAPGRAYDTMRLIQAAQEQLARQAEQAKRVEIIREALMLYASPADEGFDAGLVEDEGLQDGRYSGDA